MKFLKQICLVILFSFLGELLKALSKHFRLKSEVAQGVAFGTAAHVIGTSKAVQLSQLTGAVSSLSLTLAGLITAIAMSFLAQYI